ncbi:MAG: nucleotidyltransferase domain-containing protein [Deltaproteobacteria bacterium]|nr:nucleotidyltransferase domain-containing protein [Deltaproteobacteria bacterium]
MLRDGVLQVLSVRRAELRALGVRTLALFGSVARGSDTSQSDVDLLVDPDGHRGLLSLMRVKVRLEELLHRRVDVVTRGGLAPEVLAEADRDSLQVA